MPFQRIGDGMGDVGRGDHADLHRIDADIGKDRIDLAGDEVGRDQFDAADAPRVLGGQGGDDGHAVDAVRREGLQIGLDAGPAGGVRAGDRENVADGGLAGHRGRLLADDEPDGACERPRRDSLRRHYPGQVRRVHLSPPFPAGAPVTHSVLRGRRPHVSSARDGTAASGPPFRLVAAQPSCTRTMVPSGGSDRGIE